MNYTAALMFVMCAVASAGEHSAGLWRGKPVRFEVINGQAVAQGDILLEQVDDVGVSPKDTRRDAAARNVSRFLWPEGIVYYSIDPALPNQKRVTDAIEHWNTNTPIRLVERSSEENYVRFARRDGECNSFVGMIGREQAVNLGDNCSTGNIIHEIGHAVGLFHEQSRNDRGFWVEVLLQNADKRQLANFGQVLTGGQDLGGYDYSSIMHYEVSAFTRNGKPVLQSIPAGIPFNQRDALSPGDLDAIRRLYGFPSGETTISTFPFGLDVIVDGERFKAPRTFQWDAGTQHTVSVPGPQVSGSLRHIFGRWSDDGAEAHTITASNSVGVFTANFIRQYQMPLGVSPAAGGRLEITPQPQAGWFTDGVDTEIKPVPNPGFRFAGWSGFGPFGIHGVSPDPLKVVVRGPNSRYTAVFTQAPVTIITSEPAGLTVKVDGNDVVTPQGFTWVAGSTHTLDVSEELQRTGNDTARHTWRGWSNNGEKAQTLTAGEESTTVAALFSTKFNLFVDRFSGGGAIDVTPGGNDNFLDAGASLTLLPRAANGMRFLGWGGDIGGSDNPGSLVLDDQKIVSASYGLPNNIAANGVVNAASFDFAAGVAPGSMVTIFGVDIGPENLIGLRVSGGRVDTSLDGYRLMFDEFPAPLIYVARSQISAMVPWGLTGRSQTTLRLSGPGWNSGTREVAVIRTHPGLFTASSSGRGPAAALNQDGSANGPDNPATRGSVVVLYGTGGGVTNPAGTDGAIVSANTLPRPVVPVKVRIAGLEARVHYAGGAPGLVSGVLQVNVEVPIDSPTGSVPVVLGAGDSASLPGVTIFVR